jgi:hypothetical protein
MAAHHRSLSTQPILDVAGGFVPHSPRNTGVILHAVSSRLRHGERLNRSLPFYQGLLGFRTRCTTGPGTWFDGKTLDDIRHEERGDPIASDHDLAMLEATGCNPRTT